MSDEHEGGTADRERSDETGWRLVNSSASVVGWSYPGSWLIASSLTNGGILVHG